MREQELKMAIFQDGFQNGRQDGLKRRGRQIARKMLRDNMSLTLISKYTGLTEKEILKLKGKSKISQ